MDDDLITPGCPEPPRFPGFSLGRNDFAGLILQTGKEGEPIAINKEDACYR